MKKAEAVIFDMDGTLYSFPENKPFGQSPFGQAIQQNARTFIAKEFGLSAEAAEQRYTELQTEYGGETSIGIERAYGVDRMRFFENTWNLDPEKYITPAPGLREALEQINAERIVLSAAPRIWVDRALGYMGVADLFGKRIITGEPDLRKPNPEVFRRIIGAYGFTAARVVSVGDQEYLDILPAREVGLQTVRIGSGETAADILATDVIDAIRQLRERGIA